MKEKKIIKTFFMILCILSIYSYIPTEAKTTCTTQEKNTLIQLAHNVKFDYELLPDEGNLNRSFSLTISNLFEGIEVRYGSTNYSFDKKSKTPGIVKMDGYFAGGQTHKILIYASSTSACKNQILATKMITIPKYNSYSERDECTGIEDFKLCQRWYAGTFTEEEFQQQTKAYKISLTSKSEEKSKEDEKSSVLDKFVELYKDNLLISIGFSILLVLMIVLIIRKIIKKKNRVKIDL